MDKVCAIHGPKPGNYCDNCGAELVEPGASNPNAPYKISGKKPCPGCNYQLNHGHQRFCPGCGHALIFTCR